MSHQNTDDIINGGHCIQTEAIDQGTCTAAPVKIPSWTRLKKMIPAPLRIKKDDEVIIRLLLPRAKSLGFHFSPGYDIEHGEFMSGMLDIVTDNSTVSIILLDKKLPKDIDAVRLKNHGIIY